jgi:NAD(P)H-quinone oxidoreductase subunit 4
MLSGLIWLPVLGALAISLWPNLTSERTRALALVFANIVLLLTVVIALQFNIGESGLQLREHFDWIRLVGLSYSLGVDGVSLPLLILNSFLVWIAILCSNLDTPRFRLYYGLMLLTGAGIAGSFLAQNALLFTLFYELVLIPIYCLINFWGGTRRNYAATKFLLYTAISGILLLAAFFGLAGLSGVQSFDFEVLRAQHLPMATQAILLGCLILAFAIKMPLVPFHTWLPDAHVEAPTSASVLLAGILLKLGTYGLLRFGLGFFPELWHQWAPWLASWAAFTVLYGCMAALAQNDMKQMVAYSSVSHMGYVLLALAVGTPLSVVAAICQMVSHGLISALLFLLVGVVYRRSGSRDLRVLRGLLNPEKGMPLVGSLLILAVMASAGIPSMIGFVAEFLVFRSSFVAFPIQTLFSMIGTGLTAVYLLNMINRAFFGRLPKDLSQLPKVLWIERIPAIAIAVVIVILGIQPGWLTRWSEATASTFIVPTIAQER